VRVAGIQSCVDKYRNIDYLYLILAKFKFELLILDAESRKKAGDCLA
jgi:hypothetical protein